ncbi:MAG: tetraacyldisaccharide 4'-kinase [Planctomycetota bacterium]
MNSPLPPPLRPLGPALAAVYRAGLNHNTRRFDRGQGVVTLDRPVISIGNLSVGGTGKSPMVANIVRTLRDAGHTPAIAMRGYKSTNGLSDEADSYTRALPEVPVIANPDRLHALLKHFASEDGERTDCIVLDDGFQHRKLARQLDLVLIDATRSPFDDRLLPAGFLREATKALARATAVIITHADRVDATQHADLCARIESLGPPIIASTTHAWLGLDVFENAADHAEPIAWLRGRRLAVVTAIGRPESVLAAARDAVGTDPAAVLTLPDHDPYAPSTLARIERLVRDHAASALLVTDKDWSKLRHKDPERFGIPIARPRLGLGFLDGEDRLARLVRTAAAQDPDDGPINADRPID